MAPEASHLVIAVSPSVRGDLVTLRARLCVEDHCYAATLLSRAGNGTVLGEGVLREGRELHVLAGAFGEEPFRAGATYHLTVTARAAHHRKLARQQDSFELDKTRPNGDGCDPTRLVHDLVLGT